MAFPTRGPTLGEAEREFCNEEPSEEAGGDPGPAERVIADRERALQDEEHEKWAKVLAIAYEDLAAQFAELDRLPGLIPICAYCKRIRQEQGLWQQMEGYIMEHSRALFSHTICDACKEKEFGDFLRGGKAP